MYPGVQRSFGLSGAGGYALVLRNAWGGHVDDRRIPLPKEQSVSSLIEQGLPYPEYPSISS
jgi:hypothetical protein